MAKQKFRLNSEKLLSFSAMAISFITLLIFIYQTNLMSRQNYLSIMPYLEISTSTSTTKHSFTLDLKNHGVGPAIIESVMINYQGKTYNLEDYGDHLFNFFASVEPRLDSFNAYSFATLDKGMAIPANTAYQIIGVKDSSDFQIMVSTLERLLDEGMKYEITYKSIQNERWRIHNNTDGPEKLR